jgi:excisionase family DNA binding protein
VRSTLSDPRWPGGRDDASVAIGALLTAREVAEVLDVTPATVLRWTRAGEFPAVQLPSGQIRYREDEFEEWLADRATGGQSRASTIEEAC